ncbi:MAG: TRAP transporter substrate-binding protein DctP [Chloroflexota bacterium]|nr:TRAP transporter substrate-binding protein DctP [Chloroflexota bacterium]
MGKRVKVVFMISVVAIFMLSTTLTNKGAVYAKTFILKFADYHHERDPLFGKDGICGDFSRRVEELSEGRVRIKVYYGQSLLKARELVDGVRKGIADISFAAYALDPRMVLTGAFELPFYYPSDEVLYEAVKATQSIWETNFTNLGLKVLFPLQVGGYQLFSKVPVEKLEDFNGLRIRAPGGLMTKTVKFLGAVPVTVTVPEMYTAFQRGMLRASFNLPTSAEALHIYEVSKHLIIADSWSAGGGVFMKRDTFNELPEDIQNVLIQAGQESRDFIISKLLAIRKNTLKSLEAKGMKLYVLPSAERARWKSATNPIVEMWLGKSGEAGRKMLEIINKVIEKYER